MKNLFTLIFLILMVVTGYTQEKTIEELNAEKSQISAQIGALQGQIDPLQAQVNSINSQLEVLKGWKTGTFGTIGFNQSTFNNWIKGANPNSTSSTISASFNGFANRKAPNYFWRNSGNINLGWQKLDINTEEGEDAGFERVADVLRITSLYGRNITPKLALSALGEYNTALLSNINNPGILDLGAGFTWNPEDNLVVVLHPVNYHWVFGDNPAFGSALGAKLVVDYVKTFPAGITWRSNLTSFLPYQSQMPSLKEYTWTNGFAFSAWKGIGVGIEYALRNAEVEFDGTQSYFVLGLSYAL
jgi:hypothetical protein